MPFTFSHTAIVLPLALLPRRWFSLTGLVIGSMVPDFEYFIRMRVRSDYSHTIAGLFWFDLPLALLLGLIFHSLVRNDLINNLPHRLQARLARFKDFNFNAYLKRNWLVFLFSALIGAASHLFWDSFTHADGYFVQAMPMLASSIQIDAVQFPLYKLLQHGSTLIGAVVIMFVVWMLPTSKENRGDVSFRYWVIFSAVVLLVLCMRLISGLDVKQYGHFIVTGIAAFMIALLVAPFIQKSFKS